MVIRQFECCVGAELWATVATVTSRDFCRVRVILPQPHCHSNQLVWQCAQNKHRECDSVAHTSYCLTHCAPHSTSNQAFFTFRSASPRLLQPQPSFFPSSPAMSLLRAIAILSLVCFAASPVVCQGTAYSLSLYVPSYSPSYTWSSSSSPSVTVSLPPFERVNVTAVSFVGVLSINGTCGNVTAAPSSVFAPSLVAVRYDGALFNNFTCSYSTASLVSGQQVAISLTLVWVGPIVPQPVALSPSTLPFASITSMATASECSTLLVVASTVAYNYGGSIYEMSPSFTLGRTYTGTFTDAAADANFVYGLSNALIKLSRSTGAVVGQYTPPGSGYVRSVALDPINNVLFAAYGDSSGRVIRVSTATMTLLSTTTVPLLPGPGQTLTARYSPSLQSVVIAQQSPAVHFLYNVVTNQLTFVQTTNPNNIITNLLAVDGAGLAFLEDANYNQIVVVNASSGVEVTSFRQSAVSPSYLYNAAAVDCAGGLYLANTTRIVKVANFATALPPAPAASSVRGDPLFVGTARSALPGARRGRYGVQSHQRPARQRQCALHIPRQRRVQTRQRGQQAVHVLDASRLVPQQPGSPHSSWRLAAGDGGPGG